MAGDENNTHPLEPSPPFRHNPPQIQTGAEGAAPAKPEISSPDYPERKRPAHMPVIESRKPVILFLTVCTHARKPLLARDEIHHLLLDAWSRSTLWQVGRYVIMPDHIHLFAAPSSFPVESIRKWTSYWKSHVTRHWPNQSEPPIWQTDV